METKDEVIMEWKKIIDELPPFNSEVVLLSDKGITRTAYRRTEEYLSRLRKSWVVVDHLYEHNGIPLTKSFEGKWAYWCLLPPKPNNVNHD